MQNPVSSALGFGDKRTLNGLVNKDPSSSDSYIRIVGSGITELLWNSVIPVEVLWDLEVGLCPWKHWLGTHRVQGTGSGEAILGCIFSKGVEIIVHLNWQRRWRWRRRKGWEQVKRGDWSWKMRFHPCSMP